MWDDGHRRYEHQAHYDRLYITKAKSFAEPLAKHYKSVTPDIESFKKRGRHLIELGTRKSDGTTLKGFRVEAKDTRREIWIDAETNLFVENKVFVQKSGQWELYRQRFITHNKHSSYERAVFVLNELGLELVEVQKERTVWVAHYNGQTLKPWDQVVAPVPRGEARATYPGMDFSSNPTTLKTLFESFAYYQDYDLQADKIMIIDETGLPSRPEPGQPETSVAVSSANPFWKGEESIDMARKWFLKEFGVTFTQETQVMTVYEVRHKQTILPD
ncbi:MAG: hypothetical protein GY809_20875 [Planctomycetes bacterium]|nr:hypothetical protein [Planctomycetota bacterium]